jgi:hypothetical protein
MPSKTELSEKISEELKARGFRFVGPTTVYAFMQAVGIVNDHTRDCFLFHAQPKPSDKHKESDSDSDKESESESDRRSSRSKRLRSK